MRNLSLILLDSVIETLTIAAMEAGDQKTSDRIMAIHDQVVRLKGHQCDPEGCDHASSCAVHNEPALPNGPCDCGHAGAHES